MSSIKSEWPLLVFTTCAPVCAGAWIVAAALTLFGASPQASALTGPCGAALCALLVVSLACSTLHLPARRCARSGAWAIPRCPTRFMAPVRCPRFCTF
ncbi:MAG: DmsC/YnfH family molybdoenzyme membrane anchor subunit [Eggerthellaceae bacterium]